MLLATYYCYLILYVSMFHLFSVECEPIKTQVHFLLPLYTSYNRALPTGHTKSVFVYIRILLFLSQNSNIPIFILP